MRWRFLSLICVLAGLLSFDWFCIRIAVADPPPLTLNFRKRIEVAPDAKRWHAITTRSEWNPRQTAIVICDMWDRHWCPNATARVAEMAPRMNEVVKAARARGVMIIHCPSDTMDFYKDAPQRKRAQLAPAVEVTRPLERWCKIDPAKESPLPIDDSDGGCDCEESTKSQRVWSRQIATIEIHDEDAITDSDEAFRLMKSNGITNVIVMGVHTNMCVLGRPFSIRQMVYQGMNVALMRDMTDTMYNPAMKPYVSHFTGNDLVVEHIEEYWCPTLTSNDIIGGKPFRFREDHRPHVVILAAEDEYQTEVSLPRFAASYLGKEFKTSFVFEVPSSDKTRHNMPGLDVVNEADVLLISTRRRILPQDQLDIVKRYVRAGKPVVGIRTASHAFSLRDGEVPEGYAEWREIDREVIGGNYQGHSGNGTKALIKPLATVSHPILNGVSPSEFQSGGTLYLTSPLDPNATEVMRGRIEGDDRQHPAAWTFQRADGGRTFYTSAGHADDFMQPSFRRMLLNAIYWAAGRDVPPADFQMNTAATTGEGDTRKQDWTIRSVPGALDSEQPLPNQAGYGWYRCVVKIPEQWKSHGTYLYLERVKGACESFVNGTKVGVSGAMPPNFVDGGENQHRYLIPDKILKPGELNTIAIRVFTDAGAGGFHGGAPHLIAGKEAISLAGNWSFRTGDDLTWATFTSREGVRHGMEAFSKVVPAPEVSRFATVIRREAQATALSPQESMEHFKVPDDLQVDLVLSEPIISQPLFMNFDERGRLWVLQYLQYPEPAGLTLLSKDQWWRAVYDKVPLPPPHGVKGIDKITIHEDTNGDGVFDKHKTFVDDLNIATAFVQGRGGLWVLNPPYLLFYPDKNGDDVPDGDPEVHLSGFGIEDTHSVINSLRWGPDGWLYAAQGSTVSAAVTLGGPPAKDATIRPVAVRSLGQNIWRYHPETKRYEIFSEGGGNAFGLEIDSAGRVFSGHNGGNTRGFHYMQGAYLQKGFSKHGPLSNPYSFGYFPAMEHHDVPRFTHEFLIYEGADGPRSLPEKYRGHLFGAAAILSHVVISDVEQIGSTFKTKDVGYAIESSDSWFRPVDVIDGPDGAIYVADWYDGQLAHTANYQGGLDREHGRIYRIRSRLTDRATTKNRGSQEKSLGQMTSLELIDVLSSRDRWHRETARRILADRKDASIVPTLRTKLFASSGQLPIELLWALYLSGGLDDQTALKALNHATPQVRLWVVRLMADEKRLPSDIAVRVAKLAATEPDLEVRSQLAASAKRLPSEQSLPIVKNLMLHDEDLSDPRQPLMIWWALEASVDPTAATQLHSDRVNASEGNPTSLDNSKQVQDSPALRLFDDLTLWSRPLVQKEILPRLMRRFASTGQRTDLAVCAKLLKQSPSADTTKALMSGFEAAFQGRSLNNVPPDLVTALTAAGGGSASLKIRQGDLSAIGDALRALADETAAADQRTEYASLFGEVKLPQAVPVLLDVLAKTADDGLKVAILTALQTYADPNIATVVLAHYANLNEDVRAVAQSLLVSRKVWAIQFVEAIDRGEIMATSVPLDTVRRLTIHRDERLAGLIQQHWGQVVGATTGEMQAQIQHYAEILAGNGDPYPGKKLFMQMCGKCHTLHATGGKIGPDLTTYKRDDVRQMLIHIVNPSAEIREGFETQIAVLKDGRVLTGFIVERDPQTVTLRSPEGQTITLELADLESLEKSRKSLMPEGQLKDLSDEQLRNLFAYLRSSQPLND